MSVLRRILPLLIMFTFSLVASLSIAQSPANKPAIITRPYQIDSTLQLNPSIPPGLALQFTQGTSYTTAGTAPYGVAVGDLNHDGKQDLVVVNQDQDMVAVMLGHGDGTFATPVSYNLTPGVPYQVVLADFNGDGKLDVAVITGDINGYTSYVVVLLGNGDGTLGAPTHYDSGTSGLTIIAADVNGDGKQDVVVGGNGNLSVLYGNGNGTFQTPIPLSSPEGALWSAGVGDFNHDGRLDIVGVIFYPLAGITIFLQNPDGSFSTGQTYMTRIPIGIDVGVGDFNQDGNLDVLISANRAGAASFLGNGDGTFQSPIRVYAGPKPAYFALADFNRDGLIDVAFANNSTISNPEGVEVAAGRGQGRFAYNTVSMSTSPGTQVVAVGDFNGDGWPDIVSANTTGNNITVFLNTIGVNLGPQQFVSIPPCRLVDTRASGGAIPGDTIATFPLPQEGICGSNIPGTAAAYALNVTVVPNGPLGYLTIWPAGANQPTVSTMNSPDGRIKANATIVPGGNQGGVMVYVTDTADIILDINGYFTPPATDTYQFYALMPCRIVDTRNGRDGGTLQAGVERDYTIPPNCGVPADAVAYSFNVTVVPGREGLDYLTVWPKGQARPAVSTLNNNTGTIVANAAVVPAGSEGATAFYPNNHNTDLLVDVDGYFAAPGQNGLSMYPVVPCRVIDTRQNGGSPFVGEKTVDVGGSACTPPSNAQAYILNATVVPPGSMPYLTLWPDLDQQPNVSTLNAYDGFITSNMAIVLTHNGSIDAYAAGLTHLILDISGYFAP